MGDEIPGQTKKPAVSKAFEVPGNIAKAFDFAQETTKQMLALATGILALTVTFLDELASDASATARLFLYIGWGLYILSALCGVVTLMSLSGNLERPGDTGVPTIYRQGISWPSRAQALFFLLAVLLTVIFGILAT